MPKQLTQEEVKDLQRRHKVAVDALAKAVRFVGMFRSGGAFELWSDLRKSHEESLGKKRLKK